MPHIKGYAHGAATACRLGPRTDRFRATSLQVLRKAASNDVPITPDDGIRRIGAAYAVCVERREDSLVGPHHHAADQRLRRAGGSGKRNR